MKTIKQRLVRAAIGVAAVAALTVGVSTPAQAATRNVNCGTSGYAVVQGTNYYSPYSQRMYVYNYNTGAFYGSVLVPGGGSKTWYTALRNARVVLNGNGVGINGWCAY
jgi:hypothetical protein